MVWQAAIALVFVVLHGCQNLEERSFIPLTQWEKNTQVSVRDANLILQLLALCIVDTIPSSWFAVLAGAEDFSVAIPCLYLPLMLRSFLPVLVLQLSGRAFVWTTKELVQTYFWPNPNPTYRGHKKKTAGMYVLQKECLRSNLI